jgi:SulP family sulfate permease
LKKFLPKREFLKSDLIAGFGTGLFSIPEGMAYAKLAGVNPVYGLYSGIMATIVASLTTGTVLMISTLTSAIAISTASVLAQSGIDPAAAPAALFTLTFLVGATMLLLGLLRLGNLVNYVSNAVLTGFVAGVSLLIIIGELGDLTGYEPNGENKVQVIVDWITHVPNWKLTTAIVGFGSILFMIILKRIRPVERFAAVLTLLLGSITVNLVSLPGVALVGDIAKIPSSFPLPMLPDFTLVPELALGAVSVALIALMQGASIATAIPNPGGGQSSPSRDFVGQGLGNIAGSFFQSMATGGSLSRTGVSSESGAKSRWAGLFAGLWLALIVLFFGSAAEKVPLALIGGMLCVIGVELIAGRWADMKLVLRTSPGSSLAMLVTFVAVLFIPLQWAIFLGAGISYLLYIYTSATSWELVALRRTDSGRYEEYDPPSALPSGQVTVVQHKGNQFFAQIPAISKKIPDPSGATKAVLVFRFRDVESASSTNLKWLEHFSARMRHAGNRVIVEGVEPSVMKILKKSGLLNELGEECVFPAMPEREAALDAAIASGQKWIKNQP